LSEEFGKEPGTYSSGHLVAALKALGFDLVLDTNTAADLTVCEEATELIQRINAARQPQSFSSKPLPLFTSCCPGWMNLVEKSYPELAPYISTCKSPHMMYGAVLKEYASEWLHQPASDVYICSIMPCVRKRGESDRPAFVRNTGDGSETVRDVDNVLTTKDVGVLLRQRGVDPVNLTPLPFDSPFTNMNGTGTGAGQLFGATGGVMEAAVRTAYEILTGQSLPALELQAVRGLDGVKEAVVSIPLPNSDTPLDLRVAVVHGLGQAKTLIKKLKAGEVAYDFVEVMACPGGCIGGGGQPKATSPDTLAKRLEVIYQLDRSLPQRKSHENPTVQRMYAEQLGDFGSPKAHELLHVEPVYGQVPIVPEDAQGLP
jgi:iron-only hydrogenase group A